MAGEWGYAQQLRSRLGQNRHAHGPAARTEWCEEEKTNERTLSLDGWSAQIVHRVLPSSMFVDIDVPRTPNVEDNIDGEEKE